MYLHKRISFCDFKVCYCESNQVNDIDTNETI